MGWVSDQVRLRRQRVFALDLSDQLQEVAARIPVEMIPVDENNVELARSFRTAHTIGNFTQFLRQGYLGLYAAAAGGVVGHAWAAICREEPFCVCGYFQLRPGEALILYCNVVETSRGQQIYPAMLAALTRRIFKETMTRRVLVDTAVDNHASLHGIVKAGFRPVGTGTYLQIRGHLIFARLRNV
jgi:RimJ/RimL family protein N-acetyltransferase